jgi:hypothetical protein
VRQSNSIYALTLLERLTFRKSSGWVSRDQLRIDIHQSKFAAHLQNKNLKNVKKSSMTVACSVLIRLVAFSALFGAFATSWAFGSSSEMALLYRAQVEKILEMPASEIQRYAMLAEDRLFKMGISLAQQQYLLVVDRDPEVQAIFLYWRSAQGEYQWVGASPVSTGRPGSYEHFETPTGVFDHNINNLDFRAEGTRNSEGIRGYGAKGMRIYDFGWQSVPKGWGNGAMSQMRLQMHSTDPELLERRLGSVQSKGCIRIPASLNLLLDHYGVLDADYEQALREGRNLWMLDPQRQQVVDPGRYLIVVDSQRTQRPEWSPAPVLPHRRAVSPKARPLQRM